MDANKNIYVLDEQAESICYWGAARAGVIVVVPVVGTIALMANEVYMITRIADTYGIKINESAIVGFVGALGGTFVGQTLATLIPFAPLQVPIAVGVTYAVGKAAQAWIKDGMPSGKEKYLEIFNSAKQEAKSLTTELVNHPFKNKPLGDEKRDFSK